MKTILALAILACPLRAESAAKSGFDELKKLEGSWESTTKDHPCTISYKVSSGGSILMETMTMPNHAEMVTIYHPDGDALVMTHYCTLGNQPHMKAAPDSKAGVYRFVCDGGSNMKCATDKHMHSLVLTIEDADHIRQDWAMYDGGKELGVHSFQLARKK